MTLGFQRFMLSLLLKAELAGYTVGVCHADNDSSISTFIGKC
jgi:hypothetical protein